MNCYNCEKDIDLELTPNEEDDMISKMKESNVILICIECSDSFENCKNKY